jgi:hypothetical protein
MVVVEPPSVLATMPVETPRRVERDGVVQAQVDLAVAQQVVEPRGVGEARLRVVFGLVETQRVR